MIFLPQLKLKVLYLLIYPGKVDLIHIYIIFADPIFGFLKRDISANNVFSSKLIPPLDLFFQNTISNSLGLGRR